MQGPAATDDPRDCTVPQLRRLLDGNDGLRADVLAVLAGRFRGPVAVARQVGTLLADGLAGELNPEQQELLDVVLEQVTEIELAIEYLLARF